ncbi:aldo/keto reductase [Synechococcus sp. MIT S1220]|uniref:aldo/keto reductase n=1 Tax=Synechococcus sp. MIT S1220 TaxID=3082549 RepID=UPI0039B05CCC
MMSFQPRCTLKNGTTIPAIGLGTWKSERQLVGKAVCDALKIGYRHIDCASIYGNETEIGEAIEYSRKAFKISRDDLWLTSKLWNDCHQPEFVRPALLQTLQDLKLERLDLYLIHWPVSQRHGIKIAKEANEQISRTELPLSETWKAMEALVKEGLIREIGVSNFSSNKLHALMKSATIQPCMNQVERHPYLQQTSLVSTCEQSKIAITAYSPLGSGGSNNLNLLQEPLIQDISGQYNCAPAQVLLAWGLAKNTIVIPKSIHPQRLQSNLDSINIQLQKDDISRIDTLERHHRFNDGTIWALKDGHYTCASLWDDDNPSVESQ